MTATGFEILSSKTGTQICRIHYWSPALERALRDSGAPSVIIAPYWEDHGQGLTFLAAFSGQVRKLAITTGGLTDLSVVSQLENLEAFESESPVATVDFSRLGQLRRCLLSHPAGTGNLSASPSLEDLGLFHVRLRDLRSLRPLAGLRCLYLNELRTLASLEGTEDLPLEEVRLLYLPRLKSVAPLTALGRLETLEVVGCRSIADVERIGEIPSLKELAMTTGPALSSVEFLGNLHNLRKAWIGNIQQKGPSVTLEPLARLQQLRELGLFFARNSSDVERLGEMASLELLIINRAPELPSLRFLRGLPLLRELGIYNTKIRDGDLGMLLSLPRLERIHAIRPHHRHYSHTAAELDAALAAMYPNRRPSKSEEAARAAATSVERLFEDSRPLQERARVGRPWYEPPPGLGQLLFVLKRVLGVGGADIANAEELYTGGFCSECRQPLGTRTATRLKLRWTDGQEAGLDGGFARLAHRGFPHLAYYSEEFVSLLTTEERERFEWREIDRLGRGQKRLYELVASKLHVNLAALNGGNAELWRCPLCGWENPPAYTLVGELPAWLDLVGDNIRRGQPDYYVSLADLPDPAPSCLTVGSVPAMFALAFGEQRWSELSARPGTRGLRATDVGVVHPEVVDSCPERR